MVWFGFMVFNATFNNISVIVVVSCKFNWGLCNPVLVSYDRVRVMVFNATFNNILVMLWWSVLLVEETGVS